MIAKALRYEAVAQQALEVYWRRNRYRLKRGFWTSAAVLIPLFLVSLYVYFLIILTTSP
jgi:hypothetical protein